MIAIDWSIGFRPPDKERFLAAFKHNEIGEISYFESGVSPEIASTILNKRLGPNDNSLELPADDAVELARRMGMDMVSISEGWVFGRKVHYDEVGRRIFLEGLIQDRNDVKQIHYPSLDRIQCKMDEFQHAIYGTGLGINFKLDTTTALVIRALGYDQFFYRIYDDPGFIHDFNHRVNEYVLSTTEFIVNHSLVDTVQLSANLCDKNGPMYKPDHIEEFAFEPLELQLALIKDKSIPCILHTDGDNSLLMNRFIELGIDAIHPVEPCEKFDIYELKQLYRDSITLMGNINLAGVLVFGTPEEVSIDTAEHIRRLAAGGGYICGSSHDINYDVPLENLYAMIKSVMDTIWTPPISSSEVNSLQSELD